MVGILLSAYLLTFEMKTISEYNNFLTTHCCKLQSCPPALYLSLFELPYSIYSIVHALVHRVTAKECLLTRAKVVPALTSAPLAHPVFKWDAKGNVNPKWNSSGELRFILKHSMFENVVPKSQAGQQPYQILSPIFKHTYLCIRGYGCYSGMKHACY